MWPETPTPVCVTGGFCTAQNSSGTPVIKTRFSQILSVKSISSHYFLGCILMRELSPAGYHERQHRVKRLLCVRREFCPQQFAAPSSQPPPAQAVLSPVPHTLWGVQEAFGCAACAACPGRWPKALSQIRKASCVCPSSTTPLQGPIPPCRTAVLCSNLLSQHQCVETEVSSSFAYSSL